MNTELQVKAIKLKKLLDMYSRNNHYAMQMKVSLEKVLDLTIDGKITSLDNSKINHTRLFLETDLSKYQK